MTISDRLGNVPQGLGIKAPCVVATTANITLSGEQTIDGIAATDGQRVLVKNQTAGAENGIYQVSTGNWTRPNDADGDESWIGGTLVYIARGTTNAGVLYALTNTADPITIDSTSLTFTNINSITQTPWTATSTTSLALGIGSRSFTITSGKAFEVGDLIMAKKTTDSVFYLFGPVTAYSGTTLTIDARDFGGSGTVASWNIRVSAAPIISSYQNKLNWVFRRSWYHWNGQ